MGIQTVIDNITTAELEAEQIVRLAQTKAKDLQMNAELEAAKIVADAKKQAKELSKSILATAEKNMEVVVGKRIKEGAEQCEKEFSSCRNNIEKAVELLTDKFLEQYGDR